MPGRPAEGYPHILASAATNEDLKAAVEARRFRADLYHRIAAVLLWLAPLRTRGRDVLLLAERFLERNCTEYRLPPKSLTTEACAALLAHPWPGNVRELANLMERVALLSEGMLVTAEVLGLQAQASAVALTSRGVPEESVAGVRDSLDRSERQHLLNAFREAGGNLSRAAARLGIPRNTLRYRLARLGPGLEDARISRRRDLTAVAPESAGDEAPRHQRPEDSAAVVDRSEGGRLTFLRVVASVASETGVSAESRIFEVVGDKVRSFGGRVESLGPALAVAVFGVDSPEDAAVRAAHAAVAIQAAGERERESGIDFRVVASLHSVECRLERTRDGTEIDPEDFAPARAVLESLAQDCEPGTIVLSDVTSKLVELRFDLVPVPPRPGRVKACGCESGTGPAGGPATAR